MVLAVKSGSAFDLSKIASNITTAKKSHNEKNDKNMKRVCKTYGQISTDLIEKHSRTFTEKQYLFLK